MSIQAPDGTWIAAYRESVIRCGKCGPVAHTISNEREEHEAIKRHIQEKHPRPRNP